MERVRRSIKEWGSVRQHDETSYDVLAELRRYPHSAFRNAKESEERPELGLIHVAAVKALSLARHAESRKKGSSYQLHSGHVWPRMAT